jgi:GNAT superfamily N-acetyltransferase
MDEQLEIAVVTKLTDKQIDQLVEFYHNEFWCNKRKRSDVDRMLANSDIIVGVEDRSHDLVGFVRVLTDYIYKAIIFDLIVQPEWRGHKIGELLMDATINHPALSDVEHFDLNCLPEMYKYYERWAFTADVGELGFMRRYNNKS